jgi:aryl-alcohol dehydrogenase-like predicted oxidoreductase
VRYRPLGRTGVMVSEISLGTVNFGPRGNPDAAECTAMVHRALDAGVNLIDTADIYSQGLAEEIVGAALRGRRDGVLLATKVHGRTGSGPNDRGSSRLHIMRAVEASLRRLQTDWIDLYQLHLPDAVTPIEETLRALDDLQKQGKVRYIGTSNFSAWQLVEALWASEREGLVRISSEQPEYSLLARHMEQEVLPACRRFGLAVLPWSPLKGGELGGQYRLGEPLPEGSRRARNGTDTASEDWRTRMTAVDALRRISEQAGLPLSQFSLLWVMRQEGITSPIVGPRTMRQLEDCLAVADQELDEELEARARAVTSTFA